MDEAKLIEKLRQGLHSGATTEGERVAAERASARIRERLRELEEANPPSEFKFAMSDLSGTCGT